MVPGEYPADLGTYFEQDGKWAVAALVVRGAVAFGANVLVMDGPALSIVHGLISRSGGNGADVPSREDARAEGSGNAALWSDAACHLGVSHAVFPLGGWLPNPTL